MNFLEGTIEAVHPHGAVVAVPGVGSLQTGARLAAGSAGAAVGLGIRPEHVRVGHCGANDLSGDVAGVEQLGGLSYVRLTHPDLTLQLPGQTRLGFGGRAELNLPPEAIHVFDAEGLSVPRLNGAA